MARHAWLSGLLVFLLMIVDIAQLSLVLPQLLFD